MKVAQSSLTLCNPVDYIQSMDYTVQFRLHRSWNSPGQNGGEGGLSLLQGIFATQGSNPCLPHCRRILHQLSHQGSPKGASFLSQRKINEIITLPEGQRQQHWGKRNWRRQRLYRGGKRKEVKKKKRKNKRKKNKGLEEKGGMTTAITTKWFMFNKQVLSFSSSSSVAQSCPTPCNPVNRSTPGLPAHHQLPESNQTHVHWVGNAIQPPHPLSSPSPPALHLSQHQGLFKWVSSSHRVAKVLEFQLQNQSFTC